MALASIKFVKKLVIVPTQTVTSAVSVPTMSANQVAIVDTAGNILNATTVTAVDTIRIVKMGSNGPSDLGYSLSRTQLEPIVVKDYTAPTMTVANIGYDGTSGSLDVISNNPFQVLVIDKDSPTYGTTGFTTVGFYASGSSATQQEIADGLVQSLVAQSQDLVAQPFKAELLNSSAGSSTVITLDLSNKQKFAASSASLVGTVAAGDYIRIGTATTDVVYKVESVSAAGVVFELPYQGSTAATTTIEYITAAAAQAANFGIQLTGLPQPFASDNTAAAQEFYVARFQVALTGFTNTTATVTIGNKGSGAAPEIAVEERALVGEKGFLYTATWPPAQFPNETNINAVGYGVITINCTNPSGPMFLQGANPANRIQLVLACEKASSTSGNAGYNTVITDAQRGLLSVLSAWSGQSLSF